MLRVPRNRVLHRPNTVLTPSVLPGAWRVSSWTLTPFLFPFWSRVAAQKRIQLGKPAYFQKDEYNLDWFRTGSFLGSFASVFIPRFKEKFLRPGALLTVMRGPCDSSWMNLQVSQGRFERLSTVFSVWTGFDKTRLTRTHTHWNMYINYTQIIK